MTKPRNLVIVESPAKAKTIEKILGSEYKVLSSYGHIRDLSKTGLGVNIENSFQPDYIISDDKKKVVGDLQKAADRADMVWLASDEDREGEAIAWHLYEVLHREGKPTKRIAFHEITPTAILAAIQNPRDIDRDLVNAQQARRILDRIVGFELSPILWRRIKPSLSAGRVQSVALRLICEREKQINEFTPESSYSVSAEVVKSEASSLPFEGIAERSFANEEVARNFMLANKGGKLTVKSLQGRPAQRNPAPPFTTSTLQQEASRKLGFSVGRTMSIAQRLYESGFITYMRTDSTNLSSLALNSAAKVIKEKWGEKYHKGRNFKTKSKGAQEAHEAIRPTYIDRETVPGDAATVKLYQLIRMRTLASQMTEALFERTTATLQNEETRDSFTAQGEVLLFEGFLKAYNDRSDDEDKTSRYDKQLPPLKEGEVLTVNSYMAREKYSYPPARYTEATLVRNMEELGIGRPSTYAPTIQTLFQREYIKTGMSLGKERTYNDLILDLTSKGDGKVTLQKRKEKTGSDKGRLLPTDIGVVVNSFLVEHFPKIVDYNFTAEVEEQFDLIAEGKKPWTQLLAHFYGLFRPLVDEAMEGRDESSRGERELGIDPKSGRRVIARIGRYGPLVQIGSSDDDTGEKPQFASLSPNQSIATITLEEALDLMKLPRDLGTYEGKEIRCNVGRFGPYIQHGSSFVSIPKEQDPLTISFNEAVELVLQKREKDAKSVIKTFDEDPTLSIREGRWGAYIKHGKDNYRIDKAERDQAREFSYEKVLEIISEQTKKTSPKKVAKRSTTPAKSTKKTVATTKRKSATATSTKKSTDKTSKAQVKTKNKTNP